MTQRSCSSRRATSPNNNEREPGHLVPTGDRATVLDVMQSGFGGNQIDRLERTAQKPRVVRSRPQQHALLAPRSVRRDYFAKKFRGDGSALEYFVYSLETAHQFRNISLRL